MEVGRSGDVNDGITPMYTLKIETNRGVEVVEMDYRTLVKFKDQVESSIASLRALSKPGKEVT